MEADDAEMSDGDMLEKLKVMDDFIVFKLIT